MVSKNFYASRIEGNGTRIHVVLCCYFFFSIQLCLNWWFRTVLLNSVNMYRVHKWFQTTFRCCWIRKVLSRLKNVLSLLLFLRLLFLSFDFRWNILSILTIFLKINNIQCVKSVFIFFFIQQKDVNQWIRKLNTIKKYA